MKQFTSIGEDDNIVEFSSKLKKKMKMIEVRIEYMYSYIFIII